MTEMYRPPPAEHDDAGSGITPEEAKRRGLLPIMGGGYTDPEKIAKAQAWLRPK